jgi:sigma-B regulation protein RsbU (phosphoserine phosphatase)
MQKRRLPWREELAIVDRTMKAISGIIDPQELVDVYFDGIGQLIDVGDYVSLSRRGVVPPSYLVTRSSRFTEDFNPWTQRDRLPLLKGGVLGEIAYAGAPVIIDDLPSRLTPDDPGHFYLDGFQRVVALPQYDDGEALNFTCMLFPPDREIDHAMIPMLHWQGGLFGRGTQNLVLRNQVTAALAALDGELRTVGEIQRSLLPAELPVIPGFEMSAYYQTSARAGGDYYDFFPLEGDRWGLFIADVSGHGTPAAVLMAITHAIAHSQPGKHTPPARLLRYLNSRLSCFYTRNGTFVTAFYGVLDPATRTLSYASAGHNPPRLVRGGHVESIAGAGSLPLGIEDDQEYGEASVSLCGGDLLLLYTDGITEAPAPMNGATTRQLFGVERLDRLLLDCGGASAEGCIERVRREVNDFSRHVPPTDDQTLIAMRCI